MITFVPHEMQGAVELTDEIKTKLDQIRDYKVELFDYVYELMVQGAEIGMAAVASKSSACFSDCPTHSVPAYLPGLCNCEERR